MKTLKILIILVALVSGARAQTLDEYKSYYLSGYWREAEAACQSYIKTLEHGSDDFYYALAHYAEIEYFLDNVQLSDSLIKAAWQHFKLKPLSGMRKYNDVLGKYVWLYSKPWISEVALVHVLNDKEEPIRNVENMFKLSHVGDYFMRKGLNSEAKGYYDLSIKLCNELFDEGSLEQAWLMLERTKYYLKVGNFYKLSVNVDSVMSILESHGLTDGVYYADCLVEKSTIMGAYGDFRSQVELGERALSIYQERLGSSHSRYAEALNVLSSAYKNLGDFPEMYRCLNESKQIVGDVFGENSVQYAKALNLLGVGYSCEGDSANEFDCYRKALDINNKFFGDGAVENAQLLTDIASAYARYGDYQTMLKYARKALMITMSNGKPNSVRAADCLLLMARANSMLGSNAISKSIVAGYFAKAIDIYENQLGDMSPKLAEAYYYQGLAHARNGKYEKALDKLKSAIDIMQFHLKENFSFMTTISRNQYWEKNHDFFASILRLCLVMPDNAEVCQYSYNSALISKGIKLSSELEFSNIVKSSNNDELIANYERLQELRLKIAEQQELPVDDRSKDLDIMLSIANRLESWLVEQSQEYGDLTRPIKINWLHVANALKPGEAAVEFVKTSLESGAPVYGALIVTPGADSPVFVRLFDEQKFYDAFPQQHSPYTGSQLYDMVWKPLEKHLGGSSTIYFAPDGILYNVAVEYAPVSDSTTISDLRQIYRISSTRNLAMPERARVSTTASIYGGIDYNCDTTTLKSNSTEFRSRNRNASQISFSCSVIGGEKFSVDYLQGTKDEAVNIQSSLSESSISTTLYSGKDAVEESFKLLSGQECGIIHVATHGFYLSSKVPLEGDNALIQSGLLFAGCNISLMGRVVPDGVDDGILTAREISFMDLRSTDLVVLSACETGLGKVTGEGVYGLQRGFKKAGANTIIMSLWPVNDYATKLLMSGFYRNYLSGMSKRDAFLAAQKQLRSRKGVRPEHWAAFIMLDGK